MARVRSKPRFWVLLMTAMVLVFLVMYSSQSRFMRQQAGSLAELRSAKAEIMEENAKLERRIAFTKTDEYVDRTARAELGMIKEGEIRFVTSGQ
ncbi:MAG: septum formation initiator family protein [Clostridia bacterium]|nr:septum formation initiator family protein [Clostridia bacterium]